MGLLNERFLRGEVTEDTYKELKAEIEGYNSEDITKAESEEKSTINEQQQSELFKQSEVKKSSNVQPTLQQRLPQQQSKLQDQQKGEIKESENEKE